MLQEQFTPFTRNSSLCEMNAATFNVMVIWQGVPLWKAAPREMQAPGISASQPHQA
jgi:hypothetical protein